MKPLLKHAMHAMGDPLTVFDFCSLLSTFSFFCSPRNCPTSADKVLTKMTWDLNNERAGSSLRPPHRRTIRSAGTMDYFAHTATGPDGERLPEQHWQPLSVHLRNVAGLAELVPQTTLHHHASSSFLKTFPQEIAYVR